MASDFSFDVVSELDFNVVNECIAVAMKEIGNRFDFKDANASVELNEKEKKVTVKGKDEGRVEAALDVFYSRLAKRNVSLKAFEKGKVEQALGQTARLELKVTNGIPTEKAKKIQQAIKDRKLKVNASIQGEQLRVTSKSKDELQQAMAMMREGQAAWGIDLQFKNFR